MVWPVETCCELVQSPPVVPFFATTSQVFRRTKKPTGKVSDTSFFWWFMHLFMRFMTCMLIHQFMTLNYESLWTPKRENHVTKQNHGVSPRARTGNVLAKDPARVRNLWGCHFHTTSAASWKPRSETPFFQDTKTRINTHQYAKEGTAEFTTLFHTDGDLANLGRSWQILVTRERRLKPPSSCQAQLLLRMWLP